MAFRTVLVHLDSSERATARLETAIGLARAHGARLTGLYVVPQIVVPGFVQVHVGPELLNIQRSISMKEAAAVEESFRERLRREDMVSEWRCENGDAYEILPLHARYEDVVVIGQTPPDDHSGRLLLQLPEQVILASGRPVIVIPYIGAQAEPPKRILVAWNGSRESTRAVHDAMPLLERAEQVTVLSVNPDKGRPAPGADIAAHLARHEVRAEAAETVNGEIDTGDVLLSRAADLGADLIVLGAYGHSRAREWTIGGVTRTLLRHMTVPVLMSH